MIEIEDLVGLNKTSMRDMPVVSSAADVQRLWDAGGDPLSIAGMRCSQGGHTAVAGGRMLLTETLNRPIAVNPDGFNPTRPREADLHHPTAIVPAGATWSELHHALAPYALAPLVQQSSAHFTVGGSLSVNCHGRDPRQGPLSSTVNWVELWQPGGAGLKISAQSHPELFKAVLGGYGSCGLILSAELRLTPNTQLEQVMDDVTPAAYAKHLKNLVDFKPGTENIHMHYGWLKCTTPEDLFEEILSVDYKDTDPITLNGVERLKVEDWGDTELLRAGWAAARQGYGSLRKKLWRQLSNNAQTPLQGRDSRLNWLRAAISFTSHRGRQNTDILQEYFVPVNKLLAMLADLKAILLSATNGPVNVLSGTLRLVRRDELPVNLSYCANSPMACIALDVSVPLDNGKPGASVHAWVTKAMEAALQHGGHYYLPYWKFADKPVFEAHYPGHAAQAAAIRQYDAGRWSNEFVKKYF